MTRADTAELTPYSNTGGKSSETSASAQPVQGEVLIDNLSFTLQLSALSRSGEALSRWTHSDDEILSAFRRFMSRVFGSDLEIAPAVGGGRNGFDNRILLEKNAGHIAFGGNNIVNTPRGPEKRPERFQVYLTGEGCALVQDWQRVYDALCAANLAGFDVRITRVDIAADFHHGEVTYKDAIQAYKDGLFTTRGRPPSSEFRDDMGSNKGCTFYVGSRAGGKYFRAYEKGKQLGDVNSNWNRWECEWHGDNKRVIPFDVLISPKTYLAGAYRATSFISDIIDVIKTGAKKLELTYQTARYWCRLQYGKLINFARVSLAMPAEHIVDEFFNPEGIPDRLISSSAATAAFKSAYAANY